MDIHSLHRIERLNYMLGGVLTVLMTVLLPREAALGVLVGVILSSVNFTVMRKMVQGWMQRSAAKRQTSSLFMLPKMVLLMLAIVLSLLFLPISAIGLAIGFSVFLISIAVETVRYISNPPVDDNSSEASVDEAKK